MLELPGVDRRDVRVTLTTNRCTRVRYLNVQGIVDPVLPPPKLENVTLYPEMVIRERKFGEFSREFVVPAHLKVRLNFDVSIPPTLCLFFPTRLTPFGLAHIFLSLSEFSFFCE